MRAVVAPALTPDSYNLAPCAAGAGEVVAPALTPDSYNPDRPGDEAPGVVAPALTPDSYNLSPRARPSEYGCSSRSHPG